LPFNCQILAISAILAIFCAPLPASFSQKPHPAIDVLLQTKGEVPFDRAVTARSKLFRTPLQGLISVIPGCSTGVLPIFKDRNPFTP
jgi:hypothetical protein